MVNLRNSPEQFAYDFSECNHCNALFVSNYYEIKAQIRSEVVLTFNFAIFN